ncbi:DUF3421 domain-containing protein [Rhodopseudomonas palustris]|jgi:hypothetical protein|uniref:DUF3421 domain-containing protein n=1 Tax=Rhodopseudomonas palustris TaxID=1076 RepID=UPI0020CF2DDB|nr:DUF3421 domain-containing protein [Rhodopseudomonas palustris]MCP9629259.1 DUF3421 domain-containing protein [Rhodopseudomonas palustris]
MEKFAYFTILGALLLLSNSAAQALQWREAGGQSCLVACTKAGSSPLVSGIYTPKGTALYVCRANAHAEGQRAGYNVEPGWSQACYVGWGGKEEGITPFDCGCE